MSAYLVDGLFYLAVFCLIYAACIQSAQGMEFPRPLPILAFVLVAWLTDHVFLFKARGITLAKHIFGYRIVRDGPGPLRWRDLGKRAMALGVLEHFSAGLASFLLGYFTRRRRTLHDWLSGTRAVRADAPSRWRRVAYAMAIFSGLAMGLSLVWVPLYSTFVTPIKVAAQREGRDSSPGRFESDFRGSLDGMIRRRILEAGFNTVKDTLKNGARMTRFGRGADSLMLRVTREPLGRGLPDPWAAKALAWCLDTHRLGDLYRVMDSEVRPALDLLDPVGNARRACLEIHRATMEARFADTRPAMTWYMRNRIVRLYAPFHENGWVPIEDNDYGIRERTVYILNGKTSVLQGGILSGLGGRTPEWTPDGGLRAGPRPR